MYVNTRPPARYSQSRQTSPKKPKRHWLVIFTLLIIGCLAGLRLTAHHASADSSTIKSGVSGYCLDNHDDQMINGNQVDSWGCNNSASQAWYVSNANIRHGSSYCLSVENNSARAGTPVVLDTCNAAPGQIWLRDQKGYFNPNSGQCLTAPAPGQPLTINNCGGQLSAQQTWQPIGPNGKVIEDTSCKGSTRDKIACYAEQDWTNWQSGQISHESLLNTYTDGTPYEEWCADFVSYVYKQAGVPFTAAYDGWDENNANNIEQDTGFAMHMASSGYVPRTGDIAYFDYEAGHVEVVVSGGKVPTFIYGDSATIDPTTGNGQMKANTIKNDGAEGHVVYYLSSD